MLSAALRHPNGNCISDLNIVQIQFLDAHATLFFLMPQVAVLMQETLFQKNSL
jgi:hypothetical protein